MSLFASICQVRLQSCIFYTNEMQVNTNFMVKHAFNKLNKYLNKKK